MTQSHDYERTWESRGAARSVTDLSRNNYYGIPIVKAPHWNWLIVLYFFLGGISGACYVVACIAALIGGRSNRQIERVGRYLSLAALIPSPLLLILDLGRPERFYRMFRVIKLRSPMSVGTWGLSIFGGFCTLSALIQASRDGLLDWLPPATMLRKMPDTPLNIVGSFFGFFVGGYTGVLLGITAIPVWAKNYLLLGPLFLSSAFSSGVAALTLSLSLLRVDTHKAVRKLERIDRLVKLLEVALLMTMRLNLGPVLDRPFQQEHLRHLFRWGVLGCGILVPMFIQLWSFITTPRSRATPIISSICSLLGGYCLRRVMVHVGHVSAADPQATFDFARQDDL